MNVDRFIGVYLLRSLNKLYKNATYVGFTVDPIRRLRQHNGIVANGARKTSRKRPWEMIATVYGFPSKVAALQFEWAWQNPRRSRLVKEIAKKKRFKAGPEGQIHILCEMLHIPPWSNYPLHICFLKSDYQKWAEAQKKIPFQMESDVSLLEDLPFYVNKKAKKRKKKLKERKTPNDENEDFCFSQGKENDLTSEEYEIDSENGSEILPLSQLEPNIGLEFNQMFAEGNQNIDNISIPNEKLCFECKKNIEKSIMICQFCDSMFHPVCLALSFFSKYKHSIDISQQGTSELIPRVCKCCNCFSTLIWSDLVEKATSLSIQRSIAASSVSESSLKSGKKRKRKNRESQFNNDIDELKENKVMRKKENKKKRVKLEPREKSEEILVEYDGNNYDSIENEDELIPVDMKQDTSIDYQSIFYDNNGFEVIEEVDIEDEIQNLDTKNSVERKDENLEDNNYLNVPLIDRLARKLSSRSKNEKGIDE